MPGFYVANGPYKNTVAPDPSCCSDPGLLCPDCARLVLACRPSGLPTFTHNRGGDFDQDDVIPDNRPISAIIRQARGAGALMTDNAAPHDSSDEDGPMPVNGPIASIIRGRAG